MNGCQQGFRSVASFGFGEQESASKPPQAICKPLATILKETTANNKTNQNKNRMKKYKKPIIIVAVLIVICFVINSRRMSKADFDLLVLIEQTEIMEVCNNRLTALQKNPNISFENVDIDDKDFYNYHLSKYGNEICGDKKRIKEIAEENWKEYLKREWKFVL